MSAATAADPRKHVARKRFGQNFLIDRCVIDAIVRAIAPCADDLLVEIGPGLGALTEPLIAAWRAVGASENPFHVIELDRDLAAQLRQRFSADQLIVHAADALAFDYAQLASPTHPRIRIVGNLPYNISSPLLFHLAAYASTIIDQHFMLQREVVLRMVADAGTSDYGRMSVMLQVRYEMEMLFEVPATAFEPAPKVTSALVRMRPRPPAAAGITDFARFEKLVAQAFSQRRKMLRNSLKGYSAALEAIGIAPTSRAEDVPVNAYVALANAIAATP